MGLALVCISLHYGEPEKVCFKSFISHNMCTLSSNVAAINHDLCKTYTTLRAMGPLTAQNPKMIEKK